MIRTLQLVAVLALLAGCEKAEPNPYCPILPDEAAIALYEHEFGGQTIRFCCEKCVRKFTQDPAAYVSILPQFQSVGAKVRLYAGTPFTFPVAAAVVGVIALVLAIARRWRPAGALAGASLVACLCSVAITWVGAQFLDVHGERGVHPFSPAGWAVYGTAVVVGVAAVGALALSRRRRAADRQRRKVKRLQLALAFAVMVAAIAVAGWRLWSERERLRAMEFDTIHNTTLDHYGTPPQPPRMEHPSRLHGTYYRGNDERGGELFNGGNYRTCTIEVSVHDEAGGVLDAGDGAGELFVHLEIRRSPNTSDMHYTPAGMKRVYLTKQFDPFLGRDGRLEVDDKVDLTVKKSRWQWEASYPIGAAPASGNGTVEGLVYVCEEVIDHPRTLGARFHYGIRYDLRFEGGRLTEGSEAWMGPLYRSVLLERYHLPLTQWLGPEPIPEIPEGMRVIRKKR